MLPLSSEQHKGELDLKRQKFPALRHNFRFIFIRNVKRFVKKRKEWTVYCNISFRFTILLTIRTGKKLVPAEMP